MNHTITIIGLGLIGGSMAIDLKKRGFAKTIIGVDKSVVNQQVALERGLVDQIAPLQQAVAQCDLVILATPVDASLQLLSRVLDLVEHQTVVDVGSTKKPIVELADRHANGHRFVATHPMAGTEYSGPGAAFSGLFDNKASIFCNTERNSDQALKLVRRLYETLNMRILNMDAHNHDMHAAYVSHISHISSFALALSVLRKEKDEKNIFDLASGGFESTVRLANSSAAMWAPIFTQNKQFVGEVIDTYLSIMQQFKSAITTDNETKLHQLMQEANQIHSVLKKKKELLFNPN